jgi:serine/threonine protein kinase
VGCTCIELLTGKPPYFDLAPMAALFRIVQDDYPPFPDGISPALRDFLLMCFQKEPIMRMSAEKLLDHPWIKNSSTHFNKPLDIMPAAASMGGEYDDDEDTQSIVNTIRTFQKDREGRSKADPKKKAGNEDEVKDSKATSVSAVSVATKPSGRGETSNVGRSTNESSVQSKSTVLSKWAEDDVDAMQDTKTMLTQSNNAKGKDKTQVPSQAQQSLPSVGDIDDDSWVDTDTVHFKTKITSVDGIVNHQSLTLDMEDFLMSESETNNRDSTWEKSTQSKPTHFRSATAVTVGGLSANLSKYQDTDFDDWDDGFSAQDTIKLPAGSTQNGKAALPRALNSSGSFDQNGKRVQALSDSFEGISSDSQLKLKLNTTEPDNDAFDEFLKYEENDFTQDTSKDVHLRRSRSILQVMEAIKPDSDEQEVVEKCNELLAIFDSYPEQREHLITHYGVLPILNMLEARSGLRPNIPILDMLEVRSGNVRPHVLRVINKIVEGSRKAQEQLSLVGLIPIVMRLLEHSPDPKIPTGVFAAKDSVRVVDPVVLEAGRFVHQISSTSSLTLQMLIGAGGLPVLVHMVAFSYQMQSMSHLTSLNAPSLTQNISPTVRAAEDARIMVYMGIDCITQVFSVQSSRTRDFCRLFVKLGLLPHLTVAFKYVMGLATTNKSTSKQSITSEKTVADNIQDSYFNASGVDLMAYEMEETLQCKYAHRIASILWNFSRYEISEQMGNDGVLDVIIAALRTSGSIDPVGKFRHLYDKRAKLSASYLDIMELLLKCIKNLSMEPSALAELENSGAIGTLIPLLQGPLRERCLNHVLPCMYNLCRINKRRQEQAATQGLIPHLQRLITEESHLRQFALPIICDLAHTSATTREELWNNNGVVFYINLLHEKYWQTFSLNSLAVW